MQAKRYMQFFIDFVAFDTVNGTISSASLAPIHRIKWAAAKALLGRLIWFDVMATVSTGNRPLLGIDHCYVLNSSTIDMEHVSGCQNLVVKALFEISILQRWK